jgi:hypothetical protein
MLRHGRASVKIMFPSPNLLAPLPCNVGAGVADAGSGAPATTTVVTIPAGPVWTTVYSEFPAPPVAPGCSLRAVIVIGPDGPATTVVYTLFSMGPLKDTPALALTAVMVDEPDSPAITVVYTLKLPVPPAVSCTGVPVMTTDDVPEGPVVTIVYTLLGTEVDPCAGAAGLEEDGDCDCDDLGAEGMVEEPESSYDITVFVTKRAVSACSAGAGYGHGEQVCKAP